MSLEYLLLAFMWAFAGVVAGFMIPKVKPYLGYLAAYFGVVLALIWLVRVFYGYSNTINLLAFVLPWGGLVLASRWRKQPSRTVPDPSPLWQRMGIFIILEIAAGLILSVLVVPAYILIGVAIALIVPRLKPLWGWIGAAFAVIVLPMLLAQIFPGLCMNIYPILFFSFLPILLANLARRRMIKSAGI
jgi:hypothetical protein